MGQTNFSGYQFEYNDYAKWVYYYSLCVTMASIATGSIAERTSLDTYVFYTFMTSSLIFPLALAWCWEDGWLSSLGFTDYAGAGIVHLTGGITGFIGTYLCGPRIGLFSKDRQYLYMLDEENFAFDDKADSDGSLAMDENDKSQSTLEAASGDNEGQEPRKKIGASEAKQARHQSGSEIQMTQSYRDGSKSSKVDKSEVSFGGGQEPTEYDQLILRRCQTLAA